MKRTIDIINALQARLAEDKNRKPIAVGDYNLIFDAKMELEKLYILNGKMEDSLNKPYWR